MNSLYPEKQTSFKSIERSNSKQSEKIKKIGASVLAASLLLGGAAYGLSHIDDIKTAYGEYNHKSVVAEVPFVINEQGEGIQAGLMDALKEYDEENNTDYYKQIPYEQIVYEAQEASRANYDATGDNSVDLGDGFKAEILKTDRNGDVSLSVTSSAAERKNESQ